MNLLYIIEGHIRKKLAGTPLASREVEILSQLRLRICNKCMRKEDPKQPCLNTEKRCCDCGCDMLAKSRVFELHCPIGKW